MANHRPASTDLDTLLQRVEAAAAAEPLAARTVQTYERAWRRWGCWCREGLRRPVSPLTVDPRLLAAFITLELAPCAAATARGYVFAVAWGWRRAGVGDIAVDHPVIAPAITEAPRGRDHTDGVTPRTPEEWARMLDVAPPAPDNTTRRRQAVLLLAHAAGLGLHAPSANPLLAVTGDDVHVAGTTVTIPVNGRTVTLPATAGPVAPAAVMTDLLEQTPAGQPMLRPDDLADVHRTTSATLAALRLPHADARLAVPVDQRVGADGLARLLWHADLGLCWWLRDQLVLVWQLLGGWRPTGMVGLDRGDAYITPGRDAVVVHTRRHKGDQGGDGSTRTLPAVPNWPAACPVRLLETWSWLLHLADDHPLLPAGTPQSVYRRTPTRLGDVAASRVLSQPIKGRAAAVGLTARVAATTGRHTLGQVGADADLPLLAIADHLDHHAIKSTRHYVHGSRRWDTPLQLTGDLAPPGDYTPKDAA